MINKTKGEPVDRILTKYSEWPQKPTELVSIQISFGKG